jgi:adenylate cyclase, class 2
MLEVEVKYRTADRDAVLMKVMALGGELADERTEVDRYYNAPDRDFKQTDEAFRLRQVGKDNWLTYKGPKREAATKTRKEIQVRVRDGEASANELEELFVTLGYRPVAVVRKRRAVYDLDRTVGGKPGTVEVCFDDVDGVGSFVELEVQAEEGEFETAKATVLELATDLGLTDQERRSYLEMSLASSEPRG